MNLEDLARLAGVSRSTVSRVINGDRWVSDEVRARVEAVIQEHDYHPNVSARGLASRRTRILGMLIPNQTGVLFTDPFYPHLVQGAVETCNINDHDLMLLMNPSGNPAAAERLYRRMIQGRRLDGMLIASSLLDDPLVDRLLEERFPFVLVGRPPRADVSFVDVDNIAASRAAVSHLLSLGRRRVGMITGPTNMTVSIDRQAGYFAALEAAGLTPDPRLLAIGDFTRVGGRRAMRELLAHPDGPPDAVFVSSDVMAFGGRQAIEEAGLSAPGQIELMGFDGLEEVLAAHPDLSTVVQPIVELGSAAVHLLLDVIARPEAGPRHRLLETRLALRGSRDCHTVSD